MEMVNFLKDNWYLLIVFILVWELAKLILKKIFKLFTTPIKKGAKVAFGDAKIVNIELLVLLLCAVGYIVYSLWWG